MNPERSKIWAAIEKGMRFPFKDDQIILYLGIASGSTAEEITKKIDCIIIGVDKSPYEILKLVEKRNRSIFPILADANSPETYETKMCKCDIIYQDIAQKNQIEIVLKNRRFIKNNGTILLSLKAKAISTQPSTKTFREAEKELKKYFKIKEKYHLAPFEKDHMLYVLI